MPRPGPGQVLVRNIYMSVDPYMRGRMVDRKSYVPPFQIGETLSGGAVGQVVESNANAKFAEGRLRHQLQWLARMVRLRRRGARKGRSRASRRSRPISGTFGMPGLTAYAGLLRIGALKEGERVFVSAASRRGGLDRLPDRQEQGLLLWSARPARTRNATG